MKKLMCIILAMILCSFAVSAFANSDSEIGSYEKCYYDADDQIVVKQVHDNFDRDFNLYQVIKTERDITSKEIQDFYYKEDLKALDLQKKGIPPKLKMAVKPEFYEVNMDMTSLLSYHKMLFSGTSIELEELQLFTYRVDNPGKTIVKSYKDAVKRLQERESFFNSNVVMATKMINILEGKEDPLLEKQNDTDLFLGIPKKDRLSNLRMWKYYYLEMIKSSKKIRAHLKDVMLQRSENLHVLTDTAEQP